MQHRQLFPRRVPGVHFNRRFEAILIDASAGQNRLKNPFQIFFREKRRRAAAEMHPEQRPFGQRRNAIKIKIPFGRKQIDVTFFTPVIAGDDRIARTERAKRFAKRKMEIKRPGGGRAGKRFIQMIDPLLGCGRVRPERNGRITGITRRRDIVLGE